MSRTYARAGPSTNGTRNGHSHSHARRSPSSPSRSDSEERERERRRVARQRRRERGGRGSDNDADDQAIEGVDMDDVFDAELETVEQVRERRRAAAARRRGNQTGGGDEDGDEDVQDERFLWTRENFDNVPVNSAAAQSELREVRNHYDRLASKIQNGIEEIIENARDYESVAPNHKDITKLQVNLLQLLEADKVREVRLAIVNDVLGQLRGGATFDNIQREIAERSDNQLEEWRNRSLRQKFNQNDSFREFRTAIWNVNHEDEPIPPMSSWLERDANDPESDDEIEAGGTMQTYRCPISLTHFVDACKSTVCGHHYSYAAIISHINASGTRRAAKCPVGACNRQLTKADIQRDPRMQKEVNAFVARQEKRAAQNEDEFEELEDD